MKRFFWLLLLGAALVLIMGSESFGVYYQYTDENGVVRFTDDRSMIPAGEQGDVKVHESEHSYYPAPGEESPSPAVSSETEDTAVGESNTAPPNPAVAKEIEELKAMKQQLDQTYQALQAEKAALKPPPRRTKAGKRNAYNRKVNELNQKIADYKKQYDDYQEKVNAFTKSAGTK